MNTGCEFSFSRGNLNYDEISSFKITTSLQDAIEPLSTTFKIFCYQISNWSGHVARLVNVKFSFKITGKPMERGLQELIGVEGINKFEYILKTGLNCKELN